MRFKEIITESVKAFTDVGIPKEFAEKLVRKFKVKHDPEIKPVAGKPRRADLERGDMLINVLPSGEVIAMMTDDRLRSSGYVRIRYTPDGEFKDSYHTSIQDALSGMTKRGPMFMLKHDGLFGLWRFDKPDPEDLDIERRTYGGDTISGEFGDIFDYMNRTFMPRMKPILEQMVDEIYSSIRKLPRDLNVYGRNAHVMDSQRAEALRAASAIEDIIDEGFTRESLAEFLKLQGAKVSSNQYFKTSWENLRDALIDFAEGDNLARAKWAKAFLDGAKYHRDEIRDLVAAPVVDALVSETTASGSVASVAMPMGKMQSRNPSVYGGKKKKRKKTNESQTSKVNYVYLSPLNSNDQKYVGKVRGNVNNSILEKLAKKYGVSTEDFEWGDEVWHKQRTDEDKISEQDLIVIPSQAKRLKSGFVSHDEDRRDHEVEMALSDLYQCAKNAKTLYDLLKDVTEEEGIEGWVQEKIIKSNDYLNTIREYLEHKAMSEKTSLDEDAKDYIHKKLAQMFAPWSRPNHWSLKARAMAKLAKFFRKMPEQKRRQAFERGLDNEYLAHLDNLLGPNFWETRQQDLFGNDQQDYEKFMRAHDRYMRIAKGKKPFSKDEDELNEKAESEAQATAARIALAAKKGKIPKSKLKGASKEMFGMSKSDLEDFTKVKKGAPKKKSK